ncbi:MAG: molybdopterin-binding protein [Caldilineaceae bacterium]
MGGTARRARSGQIRDSNRYTLMAAVQAAGGIPFDLGISGDSQAHLAQRIRNGLRDADVLLTSGGVSMGELDLIKPLLEESGTVHFGRIRMKPGKPLTFATVDVDGRRKLVFGLPGNPVSSLVTFYLMAVPLPDGRLDHPAFGARPGPGQLTLDPEQPEHRATLRWSR